MKRPFTKPAHLVTEFVPGSRKRYNALVVLLHLMDTIAPQHHWRKRLKDLITDHRTPVSSMDFPPDWASRAIWQEATP